jgi:hypothetical protein
VAAGHPMDEGNSGLHDIMEKLRLPALLPFDNKPGDLLLVEDFKLGRAIATTNARNERASFVLSKTRDGSGKSLGVFLLLIAQE